jgi:two-component system, LuxR family, response regulator FixJ
MTVTLPAATVFVVDDDEVVARSLRWLIESVHLQVETFCSAQVFLDSYRPTRHGCLVLDVRMPGLSGLELQEALGRLNWSIPIIFITGHGDVQMAVRAVKAGAYDFVEKPFNDQDLLDIIQRAIDVDAQRRLGELEHEALLARHDSLTEREREVMALVVEGLANKVIAARLNLSPKTIEVHRARAMEKMRARSLSDLVKAAMRLAELR